MSKTTEQLSMSMFANRADYDAAVRAQGEQLPDALQQTVNALEWISGRADEHKDKIDAIRSEHAQRLTLQRHAADQAQRIADLETKCITLKELHDAAADERDALARGQRSQHDADSAELRRLCAWKAKIESQNPVAWVRYASDGSIHGPLLDAQIEDVRRASWTPLISAEWVNRDAEQQKEVS